MPLHVSSTSAHTLLTILDIIKSEHNQHLIVLVNIIVAMFMTIKMITIITIKNNLLKYLEDMSGKHSSAKLQTAAILRTTSILGKTVLNCSSNT